MDYGEMMLEFISIREQVPSKTSHRRKSFTGHFTGSLTFSLKIIEGVMRDTFVGQIRRNHSIYIFFRLDKFLPTILLLKLLLISFLQN